MEFNFSELDNINSQNPYEQNNYNTDFGGNVNDSEKYWQQSNVETEKKTKKKISFNDILTNMNLVVNKNGVLQSMKSSHPYQDPEYEQYPQQNQYPQQKQYPQQQKQYSHQQKQYSQQQNQYPQQQKQYPQQPIDPSVKHSFIYNKYFKDYVDANVDSVPEKKTPHTIEEYNKMVLEERIKNYEQKKRIAEIKSKKLMFTTNPENHVNPRNIQASKNSLRMMSFK